MTAQPGLFDLDDDPARWLAEEVLDANDLVMIHKGYLDVARSYVNQSMRGQHGGDTEFQVRDGRVQYRRGDQEGSVTVQRLVQEAARRHDPEIGEQLTRAYRRYVDAATRGRYVTGKYQAVGATRDHDYATASDHLSACAKAWWTGQVVPEPPEGAPTDASTVPA